MNKYRLYELKKVSIYFVMSENFDNFAKNAHFMS